MEQAANKTNIESFSQYLFKVGVSKLSHKNYLSDISHFNSWTNLKLRSFGILIKTPADTFPYLSVKVAQEYKDFLTSGKVPYKTINRRLSTLRHLSRYLRANLLLTFDFMEGVQNVSVYVPKREKIFRIKAASPFFSKNIIAAGTSAIVIELDKPLQKASQVNIWITDSNKSE